MNNGSQMSGLEVIVLMVGAIAVFVWALRAVYRKMIASHKSGALSLLSGVIAAFVLAIFWIVLVVIAFAPTDWLRLSPVALIAVSAFYAAWRYTRVTPTAGPAVATDTSTSVKPQNPVAKLLIDEYTMLWDSLREPKSAKPVQPVTTTTGGMGAALLPALFEFDYAKEDGEISSRRVFVQSTGSSGGRQYLEGICKTRNAKRTFRVDRVMGSMTRVDDGQMLRASELFARSAPRPITVTPPRAPARKREWETAVFFAGFGAAKRSELEELAEAAGWQVRSSITKTVDYVVTGSMAGSSQLAKAGELGIAVLDEAGFRGMV